MAAAKGSDFELEAPGAPVDAEQLLALTREGSRSAIEQLSALPPEQVASALVALPPAARVEVLELAERVDEIVPLLNEADFTMTVRGAGIEESGWLVEFASPEQRVAAVDLDCWRDFRFSPTRLLDWIDALIEAGSDTLAAAFDEFDDEVWVLAMKAMGEFNIAGLGGDGSELDGDDDGGWGSGIGSSEDGIVFYDAHTAESEDRIREILSTALHVSPGHYWRLVYGAISESGAEAEVFAARWQRNRLADLGFPEREQAMQVYRPLRVEEAQQVDLSEEGAELHAPAELPARLRGQLIGQALGELPPARSSELMGDIMQVANALAVADRLPLTEPGSMEQAFAKAMRGIDRGLAELARVQRSSLGRLLDATPARDLFRIGATVDPELRPRDTLDDLLAEDERGDWNVETEELSDADRTIGPDGRFR